jgi:hypothetical protein
MTWNMQIYCVGRMWSLHMLKQVVCIVTTVIKGLNDILHGLLTYPREQTTMKRTSQT